MEIKHGRAAMLAFLNVITLEAGYRFPGYISPSNNLKFEDLPSGCFASLEALLRSELKSELNHLQALRGSYSAVPNPIFAN